MYDTSMTRWSATDWNWIQICQSSPFTSSKAFSQRARASRLTGVLSARNSRLVCHWSASQRIKKPRWTEEAWPIYAGFDPDRGLRGLMGPEATFWMAPCGPPCPQPSAPAQIQYISYVPPSNSPWTLILMLSACTSSLSSWLTGGPKKLRVSDDSCLTLCDRVELRSKSEFWLRCLEFRFNRVAFSEVSIPACKPI